MIILLRLILDTKRLLPYAYVSHQAVLQCREVIFAFVRLPMVLTHSRDARARQIVHA